MASPPRRRPFPRRSKLSSILRWGRQASWRRVQKGEVPLSPAVDGAPQETLLQSFQAVAWTMSYQPAGYGRLLGLLFVAFVILGAALVLSWNAPWWVLPFVAVIVAPVALGLAFTVQWGRRRRHAYASPEARLAIVTTDRGWYFADHVVRPGAALGGHRLRLLLREALTPAADAHQVTVYAHTRDERLARIYMRCVPGMRIAGRDGDRILLVRVPRPRGR